MSTGLSISMRITSDQMIYLYFIGKFEMPKKEPAKEDLEELEKLRKKREKKRE